MQEGRGRIPGILKVLIHLSAELIIAAMRVGAKLGIVGADGVDDAARLEGRGAAVHIDQRMPHHLAL